MKCFVGVENSVVLSSNVISIQFKNNFNAHLWVSPIETGELQTMHFLTSHLIPVLGKKETLHGQGWVSI